MATKFKDDQRRFHISKVQSTDNNRLVDLGDSMLALLDELPHYSPPTSRFSRTTPSDTNDGEASSRQGGKKLLP